jgi:hypothetical protein
MPRHLLGLFQRAAIGEISGDPCCAKRMITDRRENANRGRPPRTGPGTAPKPPTLWCRRKAKTELTAEWQRRLLSLVDGLKLPFRCPANDQRLRL